MPLNCGQSEAYVSSVTWRFMPSGDGTVTRYGRYPSLKYEYCLLSPENRTEKNLLKRTASKSSSSTSCLTRDQRPDGVRYSVQRVTVAWVLFEKYTSVPFREQSSVDERIVRFFGALLVDIFENSHGHSFLSRAKRALLFRAPSIPDRPTRQHPEAGKKARRVDLSGRTGQSAN